jgi:hypothetical protein
MKLLVATTKHAGHKCRLFVKPLFDFITCAEFLQRIVYILTFYLCGEFRKFLLLQNFL